jgi:hypothetical protein
VGYENFSTNALLNYVETLWMSLWRCIRFLIPPHAAGLVELKGFYRKYPLLYTTKAANLLNFQSKKMQGTPLSSSTNGLGSYVYFDVCVCIVLLLVAF